MKRILFLWQVAPELRDYIRSNLADVAVELLFADPDEELQRFVEEHAASADATVGWRRVHRSR